MTEAQQRQAVRKFIADWAGHGDEKQDTSRFWMGLLRNVFGIEEPEKFMEFELPVKLAHTSFIDGYIPQTRVLIEQKSRGISFKKGLKQSDGQLLTPYQQARRYAGYLPFNQTPRWIVVCNFEAFEIHDMNFPNGEPEVIPLADLEKEVHRLQFLVDTGNTTIQKEMEVSLQAGELVGVLYDAILKQYKDPSSPDIEPLPDKRTMKKYKVFPVSSHMCCWPLFMRQDRVCAFPSGSTHPDYAAPV